MDCGPTCLKMIAEHYGKTFSLQTLRDKSYIDREGVSLMGISEAAEQIGMQTLALRLPYQHEEFWNPDLTFSPKKERRSIAPVLDFYLSICYVISNWSL